MYSVDLEQISLKEFQEILTTLDLLPGRRILLNDLSGVVNRLKKKGIGHLAALQQLLKNKKHYPALAKELAVSPQYLVVLNREINSYVSKPVPLAKLDVFSAAALKRLEAGGVKSTKDLYERGLTRPARRTLAKELQLPEQEVTRALEVSDLLRINGVGPVFARILREIGVRGVADVAAANAAELLAKYDRLNAEKGYTKAKLGLKDVDYCQKFAKKLETEIEW